MSRSWKHFERVIAARLGGKRVPITGRTRGEVPDVAHLDLGVEVKTRKKLPDWLYEAMAQADACSKNGQLPIVVLHEDGMEYRHSLVVLRLEDFEKRFLTADGRLIPQLDPFVRLS
jgi:hypothetical protein